MLIDEHVRLLLAGHEHLPGFAAAPSADASAVAREFVDAGVQAMLDTTPIERGRDALALAATAANGVAVKCCTGLSADPPAAFRALNASTLADVFISELCNGIANSDIKAAAILLENDEPLSAFDETTLLAAVLAHAETGAPIVVRSPPSLAPARVASLLAHGVDPERIVILDVDAPRMDWETLEDLGRQGIVFGVTGGGLAHDARAALLGFLLARFGARRVCVGDVSGVAELRTQATKAGVGPDVFQAALREGPRALLAVDESDQPLLIDTEDRVCRITLNRPERLNALSAADVRSLMRALLRAGRDEAVGAVLLTGAGRAFTAGHDLTGSDLGATGATVWNDLFNLLRELPKPTIAALNGTAVGAGLHLALACDIALCREDATVGESFVWIGASPDTGGHVYLQRSIGYQRAAELLMMGRKVPAGELANLGLFVSAWPSTEELMAEATRIATQLAHGPRVSYTVTRRGLEFARLHDTADVLEWEAHEEELMTLTLDMQEGVAAFLEKRAPRFVGG
jgi:enoyl-CoA hydratase/carnithine racemase